jgi:hypothetical protein
LYPPVILNFVRPIAGRDCPNRAARFPGSQKSFALAALKQLAPTGLLAPVRGPSLIFVGPIEVILLELPDQGRHNPEGRAQNQLLEDAGRTVPGSPLPSPASWATRMQRIESGSKPISHAAAASLYHRFGFFLTEKKEPGNFFSRLAKNSVPI